MAAVNIGMPIKVSNSEIQSFKSCRRRWYLTYYRELAFKRVNAESSGIRSLGNRVHLTLERFYQQQGEALELLQEIYLADKQVLTDQGRTAELDDLNKEHQLAFAMIEGFVDWAKEQGIDEGMELVGTEAVIEVPGPVEGTILRGKLDQRWKREIDGAVLFRDFKTVQELTTPVKMLPLDEQMPFYTLLLYLHGLQIAAETGEMPPMVDGALYTMLRKVKRTATAKPPFYHQEQVRFNKAKLESMWLRVTRILEEIMRTRQELDAGADHRYVCPPRPSRDCSWQCDFYSACALFDDGSNVEGYLASFYEHLDPHARYESEDLKGVLAS